MRYSTPARDSFIREQWGWQCAMCVFTQQKRKQSAFWASLFISSLQKNKPSHLKALLHYSEIIAVISPLSFDRREPPRSYCKPLPLLDLGVRQERRCDCIHFPARLPRKIALEINIWGRNESVLSGNRWGLRLIWTERKTRKDGHSRKVTDPKTLLKKPEQIDWVFRLFPLYFLT